MFINTSLVVSPPPTLEEETTNTMTRNKTLASSLEDIHDGSDRLASNRSQNVVDKDLVRARSFKIQNTVRLLGQLKPL